MQRSAPQCHRQQATLIQRMQTRPPEPPREERAQEEAQWQAPVPAQRLVRPDRRHKPLHQAAGDHRARVRQEHEARAQLRLGEHMNQLVQVVEAEQPVLHQRKSERGIQWRSGSKQLRQVVAAKPSVAKPVRRKLAAARPERDRTLSEFPQKRRGPAKKQRGPTATRRANARQVLPRKDPRNRNKISARRRLVGVLSQSLFLRQPYRPEDISRQ